MAGLFAILLTIATLITGILWCLEKFYWAPARQRKVESVRKKTDGKIDGNILAEVGKPKSWIESLASLFPVLFVVFVVRSFLYEPFQIPSGSMIPTLLVGDFIVVEKFAYGIKDPITNTTLITTGKPKRGDIVVFKFPKDTRLVPDNFIKRVVGLPGDTILYNADTKELTIYPACENKAACTNDAPKSLDLHYTPIRDSGWMFVLPPMKTYYYTQKQYQEARSEFNRGTTVSAFTSRDETLGNESHQIFTLPPVVYQSKYFYKQKGQPIGRWVVPQGHYFVMGDNRDNSEDSRFWGFVPEENLVGRASAIWMSFEKQPNEWPTGIRFERIGAIH